MPAHFVTNAEKMLAPKTLLDIAESDYGALVAALTAVAES